MGKGLHLVAQILVLGRLKDQVLVVGIRLCVGHYSGADHDCLRTIRVITVALHKRLLVGDEEAVHLLIAPDSLFEVDFHLINVLLEPLKELEHLHSLRLESQDLVVLAEDLRVGDLANE